MYQTFIQKLKSIEEEQLGYQSKYLEQYRAAVMFLQNDLINIFLAIKSEMAELKYFDLEVSSNFNYGSVFIAYFKFYKHQLWMGTNTFDKTEYDAEFQGEKYKIEISFVEKNIYELNVFHKGTILYTTPITDVLLTKNRITDIILQCLGEN